jgi:hypothetical protein
MNFADKNDEITNLTKTTTSQRMAQHYVMATGLLFAFFDGKGLSKGVFMDCILMTELPYPRQNNMRTSHICYSTVLNQLWTQYLAIRPGKKTAF